MTLRHRAVLLFITFLCACVHNTAEAKTFTLTVLDEAGKPIPKAKLDYQAFPIPQDWESTRYHTLTDDRGQLVISIDTDPILKEFVISIETPGYTPYLANWDNPDTDPIPNSYTATLEKALTIGGKVLDPEGKPVAGAMISFFIHYDEKRVRSLGDTMGHSKVYSFTGTTDTNGMWKYESLSPEQVNSKTSIVITHNDFSELRQEVQFSNLLPEDDGSFKATFRLEKGITVKGRVTDTSGKPIAGAIVVGRNTNLFSSGADEKTKTETDTEGNYALKNWLPSDDAHIGVWKADMMAALQILPAFDKEKPPTADFVLKPAGKPITVKIIDKNGKPIPGFYITIEQWKEMRLAHPLFLTGKNSLPRTNSEGRWTWKEAPEEGAVFDMVLNDQYMDLRNKPLTPREEEYVFTSGDPLNITGNVTDAETEAPVPKFALFLGQYPTLRGNKMYWTPVNESGVNGASSDGKYRLGYTYPTEKPIGIKIEAEGYEPAISREIKPTEGHITIDFAMKKLSADQVAVYGMILQPDGKPAERATVAMATRESSIGIQNGGKAASYGHRRPIVTNKEGVFTFPYIDFESESERRYQPIPGREKVDYILIVLHDTGFKRITQQDWNALDEKKAVTLEPWSRIEGTVKQGTQPGKNLPVQCNIFFTEDGLSDPNDPHVFSYYSAIADESGKFVFDRVPPAFGRVGRTVKINKNTSTGSNMTGTFALKPGEVKTVTLGGVGRPVTGTLGPAKEFETPPDWELAHIECMPAPEKAQMPDAAKLAKIKEIMETMVPKEIREGMDPAKAQEWIETDDGKKFQAAMEEFTKDAHTVEECNREKRNQRRVCAVTEDGTFRLDDIFEGDWQLTVQLYAPPSAENPYQRGSQIGKLDYQFSVAAIPNGVSDEPQDLGTLEVEKLVPPKPMPPVGETAPGFEIKKIEPLAEDGKYEDKGEKLRLSDYKGKYVILDFWAMWCGPCLAKVPELQKLYEKIKDDERFVMIGLSLDGADSEERLGKFVLQREMSWLHGLAGDWNGDAVRSYGVRAIPAMMLIDPEGKVVLSNPQLDVLVKKIEELL